MVVMVAIFSALVSREALEDSAKQHREKKIIEKWKQLNKNRTAFVKCILPQLCLKRTKCHSPQE